MSETPNQQLSELTATLVHAVRVGCGFLHEADPLRRKLVDTLLTAQMRDPAAVARLAAFMTEEDPNPPGVALTDAERMERLRLVPKLNVPMRDDRPAEVTGHGDADLAAAAATAAGGGGQISTDPARINVRPFLAAANTVRHATGQVGFAEVIDQARAAMACGHPWHQMVLAGVDPFHTYCPAGCGATVQTSTIATDVDVCKCPDVCGCTPGTPTDSIGGDGMQHKGHYAVTDTPARELMPCSACGSAIGTNLGCVACTTDVDARLQAQRAADPGPEPMQALPDGDTRDWPDDALHGTAKLR